MEQEKEKSEEKIIIKKLTTFNDGFVCKLTNRKIITRQLEDKSWNISIAKLRDKNEDLKPYIENGYRIIRNRITVLDFNLSNEAFLAMVVGYVEYEKKERS